MHLSTTTATPEAPPRSPGPIFSPFQNQQAGLPTDVEIPLVELEQKLEAAGLPTDLVPVLQPRGALSTALRALETENMIRRVTDDAAKIVYAFVNEKVDTSYLALSYEQVETVIYDKETKAIRLTSGENAEKIRALFDRYRTTAQAQHLRQIVRQGLDAAEPVTVRPGMFFVPRKHRSTLLAVNGFVSSLDGRATLGALSIVDSKETRTNMLRVVREELEAEITRASSELDALLAADGSRRTSTLMRLESFKAIRAKVTGYAELLELASQELLARLTRLEEKLKTAI